MQTSLLPERTKKSYFWSTLQISLASSFAGPMAGCYFLGRNLQQLDDSSRAKKCYLIGILMSVLLLTFVVLVPENLMDRIPKTFIPILSSSLIGGYASYQKHSIKEHLNNGAKRFSYWWCLLMILAFVIIQIPLFFVYGVLLAFIY